MSISKPPQDAASLSILVSLATDGNSSGNLIATSEVGVVADGINNQPGKQASAPPSSIRAGGIPALFMQLSEGGSNECITRTNEFPNSRRRVRRGELCRSNVLVPSDTTKRDPNLPISPAGQQVENGQGQRGNIEIEREKQN